MTLYVIKKQRADESTPAEVVDRAETFGEALTKVKRNNARSYVVWFERAERRVAL